MLTRLLSKSIVALSLLFSIPAAADEVNFSGCYLGGGAGSHFINSDVEGEGTLSRQGYLFEVSLGCRKQTDNNLVMGAFIYGGMSNADGESLSGLLVGNLEAGGYYGGGIELGIALGRVLPHIRASYQQLYNDGEVNLGDIESFRLDAGLDYKALNNIIIGLLLSTSFSENDVGSLSVNTEEFKGLITLKAPLN